jgi:hypothetical protein
MQVHEISKKSLTWIEIHTSSTMKKTIFFSLLALTILHFAACKKLACKYSDCGPYGHCEYGVCICDAGYELDGGGRCTDTIFCDNMDCVHGTCNDFYNTCDCNIPFERDGDRRCTIRYRDKFLGDWNGTHITPAGNTVGPYVMNLSAGTLNDEQVQVSNLANFTCSTTGAGLDAMCASNSTERLAFFQPLCTGYSAISGSITLIDQTHFDFDVTIFQTGMSTRCTGVFTKM